MQEFFATTCIFVNSATEIVYSATQDTKNKSLIEQMRHIEKSKSASNETSQRRFVDKKNNKS